jgi:hypothetical protein
VEKLGSLDPALQAIAEVCALCTAASVEHKNGGFRAVGGPTEAALLVLTEKLGVADSAEQLAIRRLRLEDPENHPTGACEAYAARCMPRAADACARVLRGRPDVLLASGIASATDGAIQACTLFLSPQALSFSSFFG